MIFYAVPADGVTVKRNAFHPRSAALCEKEIIMKENRIYPKVRFTGGAFAETLSNIYAETLNDLVAKYDDGSAGGYEKGFLHTSTYSHPGTCYYNQMWARDCGRGVLELVKQGFIEEASDVAEYFLNHITYGDHWSREIHMKNPILEKEVDGNFLIMLSLYQVWRYTGKTKGAEYLKRMSPVIEKYCGDILNSDCGGLLQSISELSGNPDVLYGVYGIYGNYGMLLALKAVAEMAEYSEVEFPRLNAAVLKLSDGLKRLVSDGSFTKVEKDCWFNGIDSRNMKAYDNVDFAGVTADFTASTRIIPFISEEDYKPLSEYAEINKNSYKYLRNAMSEGEYFRKYGFVSNTSWRGLGGRHDDTMCGYGQGFFTQSALYFDDVNCYSKCLEGIARLGYDGNVLNVLSDGELSPFVMHECFSYPNYEKALDHTFGAVNKGECNVMNNPGDEGNLVQETEVLKALRIAAGISAEGNTLKIAPKLTWHMNGLEVRDFPVFNGEKIVRVDLKYKIERYFREACVEITRGAEEFENTEVRFGPFSLSHKDVTEFTENAAWTVKKYKKGEKIIYKY